MGSGSWSASTYHDRANIRAKTGKDAFDYSNDAIRSGILRVHQTLEPQGMGIRESRDSEDHPESNSIVISLDVTGSMGKVVRGIHADLPRLHEMLLGKKIIPHPQILFGAVGDATCDQIPLQVGQFESDNRMDQNLENMILEGGGGGQKYESYELMMYIAARHTGIDCWDKRHRKGYLFIIGDEMPYPAVSARQVQQLVGTQLPDDIPLARIVEEVGQRYNLYFIIPGGASNGADAQVIDCWRDLLGAHRVIQLDNPNETSQCIALTIGVNEGTVRPEKSYENTRGQGIVSKTFESVKGMFSSIFSSSDDSDDRKRRL